MTTVFSFDIKIYTASNNDGILHFLMNKTLLLTVCCWNLIYCNKLILTAYFTTKTNTSEQFGAEKKLIKSTFEVTLQKMKTLQNNFEVKEKLIKSTF